MNKILPALDWLKTYNSSDFKGDLSAGLTVGVMLIPQGMAYAMIAGLDPIYGLYASTIPLIIYALLGTSRQLAVGPVAMVSLLTAAGVTALTDASGETYVAIAVLLALVVGLIQFLMGIFRLGFLVNLLSHPVISGFSSAAALIIGLSQLKHLLGIDLARTHHVHEILLEAMVQISDVNLVSLGIGIVGILLIVLAKKIHKAFPAQILAVAFGILVVWLGGLESYGVKIVGSVPKGLPSFELPMFDFKQYGELLAIAFSIAMVSFMESIAVAKVIQEKHKDYSIDANQELVALGAANIIGSFFQSYPVTGGFSRTAVNDQAGAKTGMASIISAVLIGLTVLFLTPLFYYLPNAILASVIMVAVFGLINVREAGHLWKADRRDFWMLIITFIATLSLGIEQGLLVGIILSLAMIIYATAYPHHAELGKVPGSNYYRNVARFEQLEIRNDILIMRFDAPLYFANIAHFRKALNQYLEKREKPVGGMILNFDSVNSIDSSALSELKEIIESAHKLDVKLLFSGVKGPVRDKMKLGHLLDSNEKNIFFMSVDEAVIHFDAQQAKAAHGNLQDYTMQSNPM